MAADEVTPRLQSNKNQSVPINGITAAVSPPVRVYHCRSTAHFCWMPHTASTANLKAALL